MDIETWLKRSVDCLNTAGIGTARLDALVLLSDITGYDRGYILAHPELVVTELQITKLEKLLKQRATHKPLAYVREHAEFYGRDFIVGPGVLVPRPETETMIDLLLELFASFLAEAIAPPNGQQWRLADVGSGSGAIGITAALELSETDVTLLEIDDAALTIAKANVMNLSTAIAVIKNDLVAGIVADFDILLCNLPYVPDEFEINTAATHEPKIAIFGGPDGLDLYRKLFDQIKIVANKPLYILTEALPDSHQALADIAAGCGYSHTKTADFIQLFQLKTAA